MIWPKRDAPFCRMALGELIHETCHSRQMETHLPRSSRRKRRADPWTSCGRRTSRTTGTGGSTGRPASKGNSNSKQEAREHNSATSERCQDCCFHKKSVLTLLNLVTLPSNKSRLYQVNTSWAWQQRCWSDQPFDKIRSRCCQRRLS